MRRHVLFAICLFFGFQSLQASDRLWDAAPDSCEFRPLMLQIFRKGALGKDPRESEVAAWITRNSDGKLSLVFWPITPQRNRQNWKGKIPSNMIALAHVHNVRVPPQPSLQDKEVARRIQVAIYTLHVSGVFRVLPSGEITREAGPFWFNEMEKCTQAPEEQNLGLAIPEEGVAD